MVKTHGKPLTQWGARSGARTPMLHLDEQMNVLQACCVTSEVFAVPLDAIEGRPLAEVARSIFVEAVQRVIRDVDEARGCGQSEIGIEWTEGGQPGVWELCAYRLHDKTAIVVFRSLTEVVQLPARSRS